MLADGSDDSVGIGDSLEGLRIGLGIIEEAVDYRPDQDARLKSRRLSKPPRTPSSNTLPENHTRESDEALVYFGH
jgi:hypothetical protein